MGSQSCGGCHKELYDIFMKSGHPWQLNPVINGQSPKYPFTEIKVLPQGYSWKDISYVIGGFNWKALFVNIDGYIITDEVGKSGNSEFLNQYNYADSLINKTAGWVKYHAGADKLLYDCGSCHTTGYSSNGHQDNLPGVVGSWALPGVQCEECHGPGSLHASNPTGIAMRIERTSGLCSKCHSSKNQNTLVVSNGFIQNHQQYTELYQGKHLTLDCIVCHDPHKGVEQPRRNNQPTTTIQCENCHWKEAGYQKSSIMAGVKCVECHMPRMAMSAWSEPARFIGDIRAHLLAIDPTQIGQFSQDGNTAISQVSLDFACKSCHGTGGIAESLSDQELMATANQYHTKPVAP